MKRITTGRIPVLASIMRVCRNGQRTWLISRGFAEAIGSSILSARTRVYKNGLFKGLRNMTMAEARQAGREAAKVLDRI